MAATNDDHSQSGKRGIRAASTKDIDQIWAIDSSATKKFARIPALADLADSEESIEKFEKWLRDGHVYIAEESGRALGFIAVSEVDKVWYIEEISVHEGAQGKGVGASLLETIFWLAQDIAQKDSPKVARVSLITYADVPWNGPWYHRHGFREVTAESIGPWHIAKMTTDKEEQSLARPGYRRCCMLWEKAFS